MYIAQHGMQAAQRFISMSVDSEFSKLPSHPKEMFFKELHQFHHETFPYIVQWESGPFYKCPTGYACGQATRSSDNSRLDKNCARASSALEHLAHNQMIYL